tara:strand:- start:325 stop:780 length:456 start_codon:yes stop_codon:yes gene_type:complete
MNIFLKWWLIIVLTIIGVVTSVYFNFDKFLYENDITKLSIVILIFFTITSIIIGYKIFKQYIKKQKEYTYNTEWFVSEITVSLGMIGTVVGFIFMLYSVFGNINLDDTSLIKSSLSTMAQGMGTALLTTLIGLTTSVLLKCQLILINEQEI